MPRPLIPAPWKFQPPAGLRIVDVRDAADLAGHAAAWAELLLQSPAASPMLSYPHVSAFFETQVEPPETWLCLFAYEGENLVGVLPLIASRAVAALGFSLLYLKVPYDALHTSAVDCLTLDGHEEILEIFVDYLARIPRAWPLIRIREVPEISPSMVYLAGGKSRLRAVKKVSASENYIPVPADFAAYHAGLSSNFRRQLKRGAKKLEESPEIAFLCREAARPPAENMRRFEEVEDKGWKGEGGSSVKAAAGVSRLFALAAERFHEQGWMEWNFLESAGETVGAHYAVRIRRTLFLLKIAYDEAYSACSPGNLLIEKTVQHAIEAGDVDEINCVADCAWHRNWAMQNRLLYDLVILPKIPVLSALAEKILNSENPRIRSLIPISRSSSTHD